MSEERKKVAQRFADRLARLEAKTHKGPVHWLAHHLHNALEALPHDHATADMHLDEFDRYELAQEYPELDKDKVPTVEDLRSRFDMIAGGMI